jgi:hypothetical protein
MKFKRYEGGGEISGTVDPKEAADKEAGLKASKGDDVGFLQRLRMGNIDDPSSEAYKRFGAGRGRSKAADEAPAKAPTESPAVAVPRPLAYPNPIFAAGLEQGKPQKSGDASVAEFYANRPRNPEAEQEADNPRKTAPKPNAPKPSASSSKNKSFDQATRNALGEGSYRPDSTMDRNRDQATRNALGEGSYRPSKTSSVEEATPEKKKTPAAEAPSKASSSKVPTSEQAAANRAAAAEKVKGMGSSVADYFSNLETPAKRKAREQKEKAAKGSYASGGSVSSASKRADGIATKGKTRGRMC